MKSFTWMYELGIFLSIILLGQAFILLPNIYILLYTYLFKQLYNLSEYLQRIKTFTIKGLSAF